MQLLRGIGGRGKTEAVTICRYLPTIGFPREKVYGSIRTLRDV